MAKRQGKGYPTIVDVAREAGVSKSLVSRALRGEPAVKESTRKEILKVASQLGYRTNASARSLAGSRSNTIGVVPTVPGNPFWSDVIAGIDDATEAVGSRAIYISGRPDNDGEAVAIETLLEFRVDGIVAVGQSCSIEALEELASIVPFVVITSDLRSSVFDTVLFDDDEGTRLAVEHLVSLGHRRIEFLGDASLPNTRRRAMGYERAMKDADLESFVKVHAEGLLVDDGYRVMQKILRRGVLPTALLCVTDGAARGAALALAEGGIAVPEEISIVGYDDSMLAVSGQPMLTTVSLPRRDLGRTAIRLISERLDGRASSSLATLRPELIVRDSTAPHRG